MLVCVRIGVIYSFIFGGFVFKELSSCIDYVKFKVVVIVLFGIEFGRRVEYVLFVEEVLKIG